MSRALLGLLCALALPDVALAQPSPEAPQPTYDARGVLIAPAPHTRAAGGLVFGPRAVYLGSLDQRGGDYGGAEFVFGGWIALAGPVSLVLRGRAASYATASSPAAELDDTACDRGGGFGFTLCGRDTDMLALGVGGELGLRLEHQRGTREVAGRWGAELALSGTGYLTTFEHVREGGGLGAMLIFSAEFVVRELWGIGLDVGARAEAGLAGSPSRFGAHASLRISLQL